MTIHYLVSVGTSLIARNNKIHRDDGKRRVSDREKDWEKLGSRDKVRLETYLQDQVKGKSLQNASAELSSLFKDPAKAPRKEDPILLIHTDTLTGSACAEMLEKVLLEQGFTMTKSQKVEGLAEASASTFYDEGLPALIGLLQEEISRAMREGHDVVLVPTGGYKAIIPYFVLMGILWDRPCIYVYEDSPLVVKLPPLPLHADLVRWTGIESILETLNGKPYHEATTSQVYSRYEESLRGLLIKDKETNTFKRSGLCQRLQDRSEADRRRSELQFRTLHSPLLDYLSGSEKEKNNPLKKMFLRLAEIGPYIWKGDRVPEMADHALLHHADLFHLAERILLPVFYFYEVSGKESFLTQEELFVLLAALHLHDCGHVVGSVDLGDGRCRRLLPTEVRDHHHVLGYLRLTEPYLHGGTGRWIHDALAKKNGASDSLCWQQSDLNETLNAVAVVGLYHRKGMKLLQKEAQEGKYPYPYPFIPGAVSERGDIATIPSLTELLEKEPLHVRGEKLKPERVMLLASLLRIIDSLDEQVLRTGGKEAVEFHLRQLETEAREEKDRAAGLQSALEAVESALRSFGSAEGPKCQRIDYLVDILLGAYKEREDKGAASGGHSHPSPFWDEFENLFPTVDGKHHPLKELGFEYAISKIKAGFKGLQQKHYAEKIHVEAISIKHRFEGGKIVFRIDAKMDEEYRANPAGKKGVEDLLKSFAGEYEIVEQVDGKEELVVAGILEAAGILFEYEV